MQIKGIRTQLDVGFANLARTSVQHCYLAITTILLAVAALASQLPNLHFDTSTEGFLLDDDPTLLRYNTFRDQFGRDEIIVVSLRPKKVFDLPFLELLREIHSRIEEEVPYLDEVTSLVNARATRGEAGELIVEDLMEDWPSSAEELQAIEAYALGNASYRNLLLSADGRLTTIAIKTSQYSTPLEPVDFEAGFEDEAEIESISSTESPDFLSDDENSEVVQRVREIIDEYRGRGVELMVAGSPVVIHEVKVSMQHDMMLFVRFTLLSIAILLFILFRRVTAVVLPLIVVVLTLIATIGLMVATGTSLKLPTMILPSFLLAVGIGDSVHILTLFYRALDSGSSKEDAIAGALEHSGLPVTLTSLTTAGGLLSFAPAALAPISDLGTYAPAGVMIAWLLSLVLLPAMLGAIPLRARAPKSTAPTEGVAHEGDRLDRLLARAAELSANRPWTIVAISALLLCCALGLASRISFSHNPLKWLPKTSLARQATERIDHDMRGSVTLEVILTREGENAWHDPELLKRLDTASEIAEDYQSGEVFIGNSFSALNVLKEINRALNENQEDHYRVPDSRELIAQEFLLFENSGSDDLENLVDSQFSKLRLTLKGPFVDAVAYSKTIPEISAIMKETLGPETNVEMTGLIALLFRTMTAVNISMTRSYVVAFVVITGLMVLMIGSLKLGLIAMIPNLLPIALAMGVMGAFEMPLDTFTLLIASISLGLAVDDTIHFMHGYRRYYLEHGDSRTAIQHTLATTGRAMLFTTLVLAASFMVFTLSSMSNIFNFGALTSFALLTALLADILLAPALMHLIHDTRPPTSATKVGSLPRKTTHPVLTVLALAGLLGLLSPGLAAAKPKHPNVIVMVADDLGWADVGFRGGPIETPSLDRLAAEGTELHRFYTTPICSPTRAALMTGRDPIRLGVAYAVIMAWDNVGIHPDEHFMPQSFKAAGYQTAMVGKWHLGHAQQSYHPNERGFDHFYGHLHTEVGYYPPFANQGGKDFQRNGKSISADGYETDLLSAEASRWIKARNKEQPFFLYVPFIAPHTPLDAPEELKDKYADIDTDLEPTRSKGSDRTRQIAKLLLQPSARPMYAAVVHGLDTAIGQILQTLDDEAIADETIVLFFSDNGGAAYSVGGADNAPLRGGKGDTFEGGIRVVSLLRWPGTIAAGEKMDQIMTAMDVFPTLAEAAGVETRNRRKLDGRSLWPAIAEGKRAPRKEYVYFGSETPIYGSFSFTAFNDEWKLVQEVEQDQISSTVTHYLFKISQDPNEYENLATANPGVVAELSKKIHDWRALYPISGTRSQLVPPPGWRAPKDWASYPIPLEQLQDSPAPGMPPAGLELILDRMHGERGRLVYDCAPKWWLAGICLKEN